MTMTVAAVTVAEATAVGLNASNPERAEHSTNSRERRTPTITWDDVLQT